MAIHTAHSAEPVPVGSSGLSSSLLSSGAAMVLETRKKLGWVETGTAGANPQSSADERPNWSCGRHIVFGTTSARGATKVDHCGEVGWKAGGRTLRELMPLWLGF